MACPSIITGEEFLSRTLAHIDCQAQLVGSYGYQALGSPGSTASIVATGLLSLFIAFFGIRLLFGPGPTERDVVFDVIKIGIVLTLTFSWPTFRTLVYDTTLKGPAEIATAIQSSSGNASEVGFVQSLQQTDNAIVELTALGTGRNASQLLESNGAAGTFEATAIKDETGFGSARVLFLASTIGTLGSLRIGAGLLLALAPLATGLLLFSQSRGIFAGWIKGLVFTLVGTIGASLVLVVELAILAPWLNDALQVRSLGYATPAAPTELLAIMLAFVVVKLSILWLLAKVVFYRGWLTIPDFPSFLPARSPRSTLASQRGSSIEPHIPRIERVSSSVERSLRSEPITTNERSATPQTNPQPIAKSGVSSSSASRLGSSYRRSNLRASRSARLRDLQS